MFRCLLSLLLVIPLFVSAQRIRPFPVLLNGKPKYEYIFPSEYGFHMVKGKNGKMGCIDRKFREIILPVYEHVRWFSQGVFEVTNDCQGSPPECMHGLVDTNGVTLLPCIYRSIAKHPDYPNRMLSYSGGIPCSFALYDDINDTLFVLNLVTKQHLVIPVLYNHGEHLFGDNYIVYKNRRYGVALPDGTMVAPLKYNSIGRHYEGRVDFSLAGKHGFFDTFFHEVIPAVYQNVSSFSNGLAAVRQNNKWGYIDPSGKIVIDFLYDSVSHFTHGFAAVKLNGHWGRINKLGQVVNAIKYDRVFFPHWPSYRNDNWNGQVAVSLSGKKGVLDSTDNFIIPLIDAEIWNTYPFWKISSKSRLAIRSCLASVTTGYVYTKYSMLSYTAGDIAVSDTSGNWFWLDSLARIVPTPSFTSSDDLSEYYKLYMDSVNWPNHDRDINFTEGLAPLANYMHKYGYIDTNRNLVIPYQFTHAEPFRNGKARVYFDSLTVVINSQGQYIEPFTRIAFPCIGSVHYSYAREKFGLINALGRDVIPCIYDDLEYTSDGLVQAKLNGKYGYFDTLGNIVVPLIYDDVTPFNEGRMAVSTSPCWRRKSTEEPYRLVTTKHGVSGSDDWESYCMHTWSLLDRFGIVRSNLDKPLTDLGMYSNGLACARDSSGRFGFIDTLGKIVIPFIYSGGKSFVDGQAPVSYRVYKHLDSSEQQEYSDLWGVIDTKGRWIIPPSYYDIDILSKKLPILAYSGYMSFALINRKNRMLTPYMFQRYVSRWSLTSNDLVCLMFGDQKLVPDKRGRLRLYKEEKK